MSALERLRTVIGAQAVRTDPATLREHAVDRTESPEGLPQAVVRIAQLAELREVVRLANQTGTPIVPRVAGTNIAGLTIPVRGGWVLDLTPMSGIVAIHEADLVAVIEPGVTFAQLRAALERCDPPLTIGFPLSPPEASVVANCLLDGLGNLSLVHGSMADWVHGLEVVRADGTLLRTGPWALGVPVPFARGPLPDLTGLFVSWQSTTGIVSKLAVELWPETPFRQRVFVLAYDGAAAFAALRALPRLEILHDLALLSWPLAKLLLGVDRPAARHPDEPELLLYMDLRAHSRGLLEAKREALLAYCASERARGASLEEPIDVSALVALEPRFARFADFPPRLDFLLDHPGGGLTWVGTYGPMSRFALAFAQGAAIVARHGFPPSVVARPMRGGHFAVLRFIQLFVRGDDADRERVRRCNTELCDALLRHGFVMYKTPSWAVERYRERLDPGFVRLARELRAVLDPEGILNPGRWAV